MEIIKKNDSNYLIHYGVLGMKWGVRKKIKSTKQPKRISRKEYNNTVKKNKDYLRKHVKISLYPESVLKAQGIDKKAIKLIEKQNAQAVKNINDARVKRGKKKVKNILYNLPGTFVGRNYV